MPFSYVPKDDAILSLKQAADRIVQLEKLIDQHLRRTERLEHQVALLMEVMEPIFPTVEHTIKVNARVDEEMKRDRLDGLSDAELDRLASEPIEDDLPF